MYFTWTGNPFVDAGAFALSEWVGKKPEDVTLEDLSTAIDSIEKLYLRKRWRKLLFTVFPNNPVTNDGAFKTPEEKRQKLHERLVELAGGLVPLGSEGSCMACGRRPANWAAGKDQVPLTGSGEFRSFFPLAAKGADYCAGCVLAIQFLPIVLTLRGGRVLLLHSNNPEVLRLWSRIKVRSVKSEMMLPDTEAIPSSSSARPGDFLFEAATELLSFEPRAFAGTENFRIALTVYYFTNYNQGPDLEIYQLPDRVFSFLAQVVQSEQMYGQKYWRALVRRGARMAAAEGKEKKSKSRPFSNELYRRLLADESIVQLFVLREQRRVIGNWQILAFYLKEVREMTDERIQAIQQFADRLAEQIKAYDSGKKRLTQLERAKNYGSFRKVLFWLIHDRIANREKEPLVYFEEYVNYLFPDSAIGWNETRDLIFFRLYEQLHSWLVEQGLTPVAEEDEEEAVEELEK